MKRGALFKDVSVVVEHSFSRDYQNGVGGIKMTFLDERMCHRKTMSVVD